MTQAVSGIALAGIVAILAYRSRALTASGAIAAFAVGAIVFGSGGWRGAAVLFAFFLPSTLISRIGLARKRELSSEAAIAPRNGWQVLANGGVAAVCALAATRAHWPFALAFAGAFAAASADTWATEIGTLSRTPPVSILTLQPVPAGRSGGVTALGVLASVAGALAVAVVALLVGIAPFWSVAAGGVAGALLDSVLGASLQALRWCPICACECETRRHDCGSQTVLRRGAGWLENDGVNFAATLGGAIVASALAAW
jgi:uncharacterized protein (TIGR00297 family)